MSVTKKKQGGLSSVKKNVCAGVHEKKIREIKNTKPRITDKVIKYLNVFEFFDWLRKLGNNYYDFQNKLILFFLFFLL